jgi:ABC-2 type transport system permease protein
MNKLLKLFFLEIKLLVKNKTIWRLILLPPLFILILGTIFGKTSTPIKKFPVAFISADQTVSQGHKQLNLGQTLENQVLSSAEVKKLVNVKKATSVAEAKRWVRKGQVAAVISVPKSFTTSYVGDKDVHITLIGNKDKVIEKKIIQSIVESFTNNLNTIREERQSIDSYAKSHSTDATRIQSAMSELSSVSVQTPVIEKRSPNLSSKPVSAMQYYAIGMAVMFSISTAFAIVHNVVEERLNHTLFRIRAMPVRSLQYAIGKLGGIIVAVLLQMSAVILISRVIYGVVWGSLPEILLITCIYAFAVGSIVLLCGFLAKNQTTVSSLSAPILYIFSFLGGSMANTDSFPKMMKIVQQLLPNGQAINAYLAIRQGEQLVKILPALLQLFVTGFVFLVLALVFFIRKGASGHAVAAHD